MPSAEEGDVAAQVSGVGREGVVGGATLDPDVVEPPADVSFEGREPCRGWPGRDVLGQERASSREIELIPWASATGP